MPTEEDAKQRKGKKDNLTVAIADDLVENAQGLDFFNGGEKSSFNAAVSYIVLIAFAVLIVPSVARSFFWNNLTITTFPAEIKTTYYISQPQYSPGTF